MLAPPAVPAPRPSDGRPVDSVDRSVEAIAAMPPWRRRLTHPAVLWLPALLALAAGFLVLAFVVLSFGEDPRDDSLPWSAVLAVALGYALVLILERRRPHELTVTPLGWAVRGLLLGALLMGVTALVVHLLGGLSFHGASRWVSYAGQDGLLGALLLVLALGVGPAVVEEVLLRGVLLRYAEQLLGTVAGLAVTAVVVGGTHLVQDHATPAGALTAAAGGVMLAALYVRTRSLWFVLGVHAAWNVVQGPLLGIRVDDSDAWTGVVISSPQGSPLLHGGLHGTEASVVSGVVWVVVAAWALWRVVRAGALVPPARRTRRPARMEPAVRP